ncbi:MAG: winged helix-turn-helix domain-containing protein [archaeon]|jgi:predicted transcriptional regulator
MNQKRDRVAIMNEILLLVRGKEGEAGPTHIMYKANLSHQMLTEYMTEIMGKGFLIEQIDKRGKRTYQITDKGHAFIKDYQSIRKFFDAYGL